MKVKHVKRPSTLRPPLSVSLHNIRRITELLSASALNVVTGCKTSSSNMDVIPKGCWDVLCRHTEAKPDGLLSVCCGQVDVFEFIWLSVKWLYVTIELLQHVKF